MNREIRILLAAVMPMPRDIYTMAFILSAGAAVSAASASPTYVIDEIGLTGANYSYAASDGISQLSSPLQH